MNLLLQAALDPLAQIAAGVNASTYFLPVLPLSSAGATFGLVHHEDQRTNKAINMTMGIGMPSIKSKIERMFDKPLNQFEFSSDLLFEPNSTLANPESHCGAIQNAKRLQRDLVAGPRRSQRNSRKMRRSKAQGTPTTTNALPLCVPCLRFVEPPQRHRISAYRHRAG